MRNTLTVLATCLALPAGASSFGAFDEVYLFGDSLSDSGNLALAAPDFVPNPPYPLGQFTNGNSWATELGLTPSLAGGTNYAFGGARASDNGDTIPDLGAQIATFAATVGSLPANPLAVIWAGGNDFRDFDMIEDPTRADKKSLIRGVRKSIKQGIRALSDAGVSDIVVFGLPDFGTLPQYRDDAEAADFATRVSNRLNTSIERAAARMNAKLDGANVNFFDLDGFLEGILATVPADTLRTRCLEAFADCLANPTNYLFYDDIHPTAWVHAALADEFREEVLQPVPLPAGATLLLTGMGAFALWGRRRKSQS